MTEETAKPTRPSTGKLVGIAAGCIIGVMTLFNIAHDDSADGSPHQAPGITQGEAWSGCKDAVKAKLRNPATADFALLSTDIAQAGKGWSISGSLKAENDFGVKQEVGYECEVDADGTVVAHVSQ